MKEYLEPHIKVEILHRIIKDCSEQGLPALKDELISYAWQEWGSHRTTAMEYLNQLKRAGYVITSSNEYWTKERWNKIEQARQNDFLSMNDLK